MRESNFLKAYKRRWTYRIMGLVVSVIAIMGLIGMGIYTYYNNENNATIVNNVEEYTEALNNDSYIQISAEELYDLDVVMTETRSKFGIEISNNVKSRFVAIKLPPFTLAVSIPNKEYEKLIEQEKSPYILKGKLVGLDDRDLEILKEAMKDNNSLSGGFQLVPYLQYLRYESSIQSSLVYFTAAALFIIFVLILYIRVMRKNTTALKSLKNFSNKDFKITCEEIDNECNAPNVYKNGPITITENYIIAETQQIVFALPLSELMWVYKETIKKKVYFVIPAGKINNLILAFSDKRTYEVSLSKDKTIEEIIEYISTNCSTSFVGYSEELKNLLKKDPDEFILKWKLNKEKADI